METEIDINSHELHDLWMDHPCRVDWLYCLAVVTH